MKKKLIIASLILVAGLSFAIIYKKERSSIYEELERYIEMIPGYENYCTDEFFETMSIFADGSTSKMSNSQLKKVLNEIKEFAENDIHESINDVYRIEINTAENYQRTLKKADDYVECSIKVKLNGDEIVADNDCKVKIRGNSTADNPKQPYNIKFSEKVDLIGTGKAKKWSLLAEYFDVTLLRNYIFQNLASDIGLEYTPECRYADVVFDGLYMGTYLLIEPADAGKTGVDIDSEAGDFMIEYEKERVEDGATYFEVGEDKMRFVFCEPESPDESQYTYVVSKMNDVYEALLSKDYARVQDVIDIDSFAKYYLVNEYAKTVDFNYSSVKFYFKNGKLYAGPTWDFDLSSGNIDVENYLDYWKGSTLNEKEELNDSYSDFYCRVHLFKYLFEYEEFSNEVTEQFIKYNGNFEYVFDENGFIDQTISKYRELFNANYGDYSKGNAGWKINKKSSIAEHDRYDTYDENVRYLKQWLEKRLDYLNKNLLG